MSDKQHCDHCGKLISYGLRHDGMIFCNDECAAGFGIDPRDCFFGGVSDTSDYPVCGREPDDYYHQFD